MAVDLKSLKKHPVANPEYQTAMRARISAKEYNRHSPFQIEVPRTPNKYVPHIGAKQRAKGAK